MNKTPETDEAQHEGLLRGNAMPTKVVTANFACKLEQQRNEAKEELRQWQTLCLWGGTPEHIHDFIKSQQTRIHQAQEIEKTCEQLEHSRDEWAAMCGRYKQERDEAKEALQILADYTKNEIKRLRMICQHAHDRLLRGAPDNDLLLILEKSWKEKTK